MKKLFLIGCPRSGTTLLQSILTSQIDLFTLKETHFFRNLQRWRPVRMVDRLWLDRQRVEHAFDYIRRNNALEGACDTAEIRNLRDACQQLDKLLSVEATLRGRQGWLEKTPEHMFFMDEIRRYIPDARFVHIVRDGADVVASLYDAAQKYPEQWGWLGQLDDMVRLYNRYARTTKANCGKQDTFIVLYNDLVERDAATLDGLAEFVGVEPGTLSLDDIASFRQDIVRADEPWKVREEKTVVDTRRKKFESLFDAGQKRQIESRLAPLNELVSG